MNMTRRFTLLTTGTLLVFGGAGCAASMGEDMEDEAPAYESNLGPVTEGVRLEASPPVLAETLAPGAAQQDGFGEKSCGTERSDTGSTIDLGGGFFASGTTHDQCGKFCPAGSFAYGMDLRSQASQGTGDDLALTGIALACHDRVTGVFTGWITSQTTSVGSWWDPALACPNTGTPLTKGQLKHVAPVGSGDDKAATRARGWCGDGTLLEPDIAAGTGWGTWLNTAQCPSGQAVCGINVGAGAFDGSDLAGVDEVNLTCCTF